MPKINQTFFYLDFVHGKGVFFGMIEDELEQKSVLLPDHVSVCWKNPRGSEVLKKDELHLKNRHLELGTVVQKLEEGKLGYLKKIEQFFDIQIVGSSKFIEHVSEKRLRFLEPFGGACTVTLEKKIGSVWSVDKMIRMVSKCGSIVYVRTFSNDIRDAWEESNGVLCIFIPDDVYVGQSVVCTPIHLKGAHWIKKSKAMERKMEIRQTFTIESVEDCLVKVYWLNSNPTHEFEEIKGDDIKRLKVLPEHKDYSVFSRYFLKLESTDVLLTKREWLKKCWSDFQHLPNSENAELCDPCTEEDDDSEPNDGEDCPPKLNKLSAGADVAVEIICMETKATVVWQDGTVEEDIPSIELCQEQLTEAQCEYEFFPGDYVVSKTAGEADDKYGVVQRVNISERKAQIKWFKYSESEMKPQELYTDEVSVYDLRVHLKFPFVIDLLVQANPLQDYKFGKVVDLSPQDMWLCNGWTAEERFAGLKTSCLFVHIMLK